MVLAVETNLQKLLEGTKQYRVPLYQRTYSWKNEQLRRLWDDVVKLAEDRKDRGADASHFIGSLVLAPSPGIGPAGLQEFCAGAGNDFWAVLAAVGRDRAGAWIAADYRGSGAAAKTLGSMVM